MKCILCNKNEGIKDDFLGFLPCLSCQQKGMKDKAKIPEMTSESIKEGRKQYWDDIHGSHRKGVPSKEFRDKWGKEAMKRQGFSDKEIANAKNVWNDDRYYKEE